MAEPPILSVSEVLLRETDLTGVYIFILIVVLAAPSADFAVIFTVPAFTPFTTPLEETVAIDLFDVLHVTSLFVTLSG